MLPSTSRRTKRLFALGAGVVAVALAVTGCSSGSNGSGSGSGSKNYKITFLPKNLGNPYFDTSDKGGET
ncbi:MAG: rhamnose ABC transporter substrate-binding protein, partial [Leifsonia sp.]